ncbi:DUF563 domain-containing protein [Cyanobium sp. Copco_Reservoir_LC18]|uniref:glycosyltransferase family 61 protein n=1 Tax=Cyanobium sp. Copco_Reservoir_LC18 TaxID=1328305 RepID=UPI0013596ED3|nr:glycosyltransferase family 61 protein [Cyanobium sp. Copco_Reservoir_LC18]
MLEKSDPLCETYTNAIASSTLIQPPPNGWISGCLYDNDGMIIPLSQRFGGFYGDFFPNKDPATIETDDLANLPIIQGRSVYLGHFMPHYGHFLLETLSTFWTNRAFRSFDYFIFHLFAFGDHLPSYCKDAFQAFGIPLNKIRIIKTKTLLTDVTIPERLVSLNKSANIAARDIYRYLIDKYASSDYGPTSNFYYISRVHMSLKTGERAILNEPIIEHSLKKMGFLTIYPELLSFPEQVSLFHHADVVCGLSGSALHNCLFMRPKTLLIEIADLRSKDEVHPMQDICNELSDIIYHIVPFSGHSLHKEKQIGIINNSQLASKIDSVLKQHQLKGELSHTPLSYTALLRLSFISALVLSKVILRLIKWWIIRNISAK